MSSSNANLAPARRLLLAVVFALSAPAAFAQAPAASNRDDLDVTMRTLLRLSATHAAHVSADVARAAYAMCGTAGIFTNQPLAQALQDALVVPQHAFLSAGTWQSAGQSLLGIDVGPGFP